MSAANRPPRPGWSRRAFLLAAAAGAAGGAWYFHVPPRLPGERAARHQWEDWLLDAGNREAVVRLGNAYRAAYPQEAAAAVLAARIDAALAAQTGTEHPPSDPAGLGRAVQARVRDEYARAEVVMVSGWVLSVTEARLYALVATAADAAQA